jgi:hypothetical protein
MDYREIKEYQIRQLAKNVAETPWLIFPGENILTRRAIKLSFIKDQGDPTKFVGVHAQLLYQKKKGEKDPWPSKMVDLRKVPRNFGFKFSLDSAQTLELVQALQDAYSIGSGVLNTGKRTVLRGIGKNEVVITEKNKAQILEKLSGSLTEEELGGLLSQNIEAISTDLALARLYHDRRNKLKELEEELERNRNESFWQKFLKDNSWVFGTACVKFLSERRIDTHHTTDYPVETEGGFMDIIEIKTPDAPFWALDRSGNYFKYRSKHLIPNSELQGAIAQTTKYIVQAEKKVDSREYIDDHGGVIPLKPRGLVIHGRSKAWGVEEWESFRLLNDVLHNVQVITFDHLLKQGERILAVMQVSDNEYPIEEVEENDPDDIPF